MGAAADSLTLRRKPAADLAWEQAGAAPLYRAEAIEDADALLDLIAATGGASTAFQTAAWLKALYETLAPGVGARPFGIVVRDARSGAVALLLPLVLRREGRLLVARFPDLGVSDYGGPILGPAAPDASRAAALWPAILAALKGVDLIELLHMPAAIAGRANPLVALPLAQPSRHKRHQMTVETTVEDYIRSCGRKFRKEADRAFRVLSREGPHEFRRAETSDEIGRAFAALEAQQSARRRELAGPYDLDRPEYSRFYAALLRQTSDQGFAHVFTLTCRGEIVSTLFGVVHDKAFTLLRIAMAGERWRHVSPGRVTVVETMRYFSARGVPTIDLGIGSYVFKERFGAEGEQLFDLVAPLSWQAVPRTIVARAKAHVRQSPRLKALVERFRGQH